VKNQSILQVHEDQLLEAGHLILFRKEAAEVLGLKTKVGRDTGIVLGGVPVRIGDLIVVRWGKSLPGSQLAFVTGKGKKGIRAMKWRGSGWTLPVSTAPDRVLSRPEEKRLRKAEKDGAFRPPLGEPVKTLLEAAGMVMNIPTESMVTGLLYGRPKSGKSLPVYLLNDKVLHADGKLRAR
jgi:hypothetical protein